jgi:cytochrome c biogenesis protein CcdA
MTCGDGRLRRKIAVVSLFVLGALVSALLVYGGIGLAVSAAHGTAVARIVAIIWLAGCLGWHAFGFVKVPLGRESIQANRRWATKGPMGLVYFGALLGIGLLTQMTSPLVVGGALLSASSGVRWAVLYGLGFAVGRSVPAFQGAIFGLGVNNAVDLPMRTISRSQSGVTRIVGSGLSVLALAILTSAYANGW